MSEENLEHLGGRRRLVLGFDAGCMTCSDLATRIEDQVGDKLEVRSLRDPQVAHWREQALGEDAPWAPTLIEVNGDEPKAWTGVRMGARLSRVLGPVGSWRVMQVLGDIGAAQRAESSAAARAFGRMSRGQFLKGVGGAVVGMSVLSGVGSFATPAAAQEQAPQSVGFKQFKGGRLRNAVREASGYPDVRNVLSPQELNYLASYDGSGQATAGIHTLENGDKMLAVALPVSDDRALIYYETRRTPVKRGPVDKSEERPVRRGPVDKTVTTQAKVYRAEGENAILDGNSSHNGRLNTPVPRSEGDFSAQSVDPCGGCNTRIARTLGRECVVVSVARCAVSSFACAACAGTCPFTGVAGCIACLAGACSNAGTQLLRQPLKSVYTCPGMVFA